MKRTVPAHPAERLRSFSVALLVGCALPSA